MRLREGRSPPASDPHHVRRPLVLSGESISLTVKRDCLWVTSRPAQSNDLADVGGALVERDRKRVDDRSGRGPGSTPSGSATVRLARGRPYLPSRIIVLDGAGQVSLEALDWMSREGIGLVRLSYESAEVLAVTANGSPFDTAKLVWQATTRADPAARLAYARALVTEKLEACLHALDHHFPTGPNTQKAREGVAHALADLATPTRLSDLLLVDAKGHASYWRAWRDVRLAWSTVPGFDAPGSRDRPPPSSIASFRKRGDLRASGPLAAMLTLAYAVLRSEMRIKASVLGCDPTLGVLHDQRMRHKERAPQFAFDLMEPLRPVADGALLGLIREQSFSLADFSVTPGGIWQVGAPLSRALANAVLDRLA